MISGGDEAGSNSVLPSAASKLRAGSLHDGSSGEHHQDPRPSFGFDGKRPIPAVTPQNKMRTTDQFLYGVRRRCDRLRHNRIDRAARKIDARQRLFHVQRPGLAVRADAAPIVKP